MKLYALADQDWAFSGKLWGSKIKRAKKELIAWANAYADEPRKARLERATEKYMTPIEVHHSNVACDVEGYVLTLKKVISAN